MDPNQGSPSHEPAGSGADLPPLDAHELALLEAEARAREAEREAERERLEQALRGAERVGGRAHTGLLQWTALVFVGALAGFLLGRPDLPLLLAGAGLFALAQSWDARDQARTGHPYVDVPLAPGDMGRALRIGIPMLAPLFGTLAYVIVGVYARGLDPTAAHVAAANWCLGAAVVCALLVLPPIARGVTALIVRHSEPSITARITAAIAVIALLAPVPTRLMFDDFMKVLPSTGQPLVDAGGLMAQLVGELVFAAAAVGLWVKRDFRAVFARLGLGPMRGREWLVAVAGLVAVVLLNGGMEWLERTHFHALWEADQAIVRMLVGEMSVGTVLVLGLSAGAGEEILVRGALQPRTGVVWAAVLFASGHVQYTWFGMLTILLLGLGLGLIRRWSNTTTVIVVHMLYDVVAALGVK